MPTRMKNMRNCHRVMCGSEICISKSMMEYRLNSRRSRHIENLRPFLKDYIQEYMVRI